MMATVEGILDNGPKVFLPERMGDFTEEEAALVGKTPGELYDMADTCYAHRSANVRTAWTPRLLNGVN
jgi:hypothetical protein